MIRSRHWESFIPVRDPALQSEAPAADAAWLVSKGVEPHSPELLLQLRDEVAPKLADLTLDGGLVGFSFLIHGPDAVPHPELTPMRLFIHVRTRFSEPAESPGWVWSQPHEPSDRIAGVDADAIHGGVELAWEAIEQQSALMLGIICMYKDAEGLTLVKNVRQFLHFFANMAQMRVA